MAKRAISQQTKDMFQQHGKTMGQRLKKEEALMILENDFRLTKPEAGVVFDFFDQDKNGEFSMWEYQHFYDNMGHKSRAMMDLFKKMEKEQSGTLDFDKAFDTLKIMKKQDGSPLSEEDLGKRLQFYAGQEKSIDLTKFINLMCCLKLVLEDDDVGNLSNASQLEK